MSFARTFTIMLIAEAGRAAEAHADTYPRHWRALSSWLAQEP